MPDTPALPLFFTKVVGLNPGLHGGLRLARGGYGFAAGAATIPLGLGEFVAAARQYPIVFAAGEVPAPLALVASRDTNGMKPISSRDTTSSAV